MNNEYFNGYIEHKRDGFSGILHIDGIDIGEIIGGFYTDKKRNLPYVWLRRKPILEYRAETHSYIKKTPLPFFECYAYKAPSPNIAYKGNFFFLHFTYDLVCCWDDIIKERLNIYIVRSNEQPLISAINKNNNDGRII